MLFYYFLTSIKRNTFTTIIEEIEEQDFILTPGRYVGIEEQEEDGELFEELTSIKRNTFTTIFFCKYSFT